jgi:hypothetical protein
MANAPSAKPKKGKQNLLPFYVGITEGKNLKGEPYKHTHYVRIEELKAARLGIKSKSIVKFGGTDVIQQGVVYQNNRKKTKGDKKAVTAKRHITQYHKPITAYCKELVINSKRKRVVETYTIGFPSSVPLRLIIKFFKTNCPNVVRIGTGGNFYQTVK